jgi:putative PIN family toxin of toxin-antitoxin system
LIVSELLLAELERALAYPKLQKHIPAEKARAFVSWLRDHGGLSEDPGGSPPLSSPDPDDDYLIALASSQRAFLVSGDKHLLGLQEGLPILGPTEFLREHSLPG